MSVACKRSDDERSKAEPGHREARDEAAPVRKPADQDGERDDISEAQPDAAKKAVGEIERRQVGRIPGQQNTRPIEDCRKRRDCARPKAPLKTAADSGGDAYDCQCDRKGEIHLDRGGGEVLAQRVYKHAPGVDGAERELHAKRSHRNGVAWDWRGLRL